MKISYLKALREREAISINNLSQKTNIPSTDLMKAEENKDNLSEEEKQKLSAFYHIHPSSLDNDVDSIFKHPNIFIILISVLGVLLPILTFFFLKRQRFISLQTLLLITLAVSSLCLLASVLFFLKHRDYKLSILLVISMIVSFIFFVLSLYFVIFFNVVNF